MVRLRPPDRCCPPRPARNSPPRTTQRGYGEAPPARPMLPPAPSTRQEVGHHVLYQRRRW
eukprot:6963230-Lingulodinium_polyedra.AAC.1